MADNNEKMECLEFKRLALSDPNLKQVSFVEHSETCPCCIKYVGDIREMDANLIESVDIEVPSDLMARFELSHLLELERSKGSRVNQYSKYFGLAVIMFVSGFLVNGFIPSFQNQGSQISHDHDSQTSFGNPHVAAQEMVIHFIEHLEENPMLPIWGADQSNQTMQILMANYDPNIKVNTMPNLQFIRVCPVQEGDILHANLHTDHGQASFAYIKGHSVGEIIDASYKGYMTRIKPLGNGGSLVIISQSMHGMKEAEKELESAIHWDI